MSYGTDPGESFERAAALVARILRREARRPAVRAADALSVRAQSKRVYGLTLTS
jgi:hypothetical protein